MNALSFEKLSFVLCPTTFPDSTHEHIHQENFSFWWNSWESVFRDMGLNQKLSSDLFTRQDFTASLFLDRECIGQICFRVVETQHLPTKLDSYFKNWTEKSMSLLTADGSRVLISSYLSVSKKYRGPAHFGVPVKDILIGFYGLLKQESLASSIAAAPRKDRNVNRTCAEWGGVLVEESIPSGYGDLVDLVVFRNDCLAKAQGHPLFPAIQSLWRKRISISKSSQSKSLPLSA
ncbi:hypothetical protein D3C87_110590 [compost metagenome]